MGFTLWLSITGKMFETSQGSSGRPVPSWSTLTGPRTLFRNLPLSPDLRAQTHPPCAARRSRRSRAREAAGGWAVAQTPSARKGAQRAGSTVGARAAAAAGAARRERRREGRRGRSPMFGARSAGEVASRRLRRTRAVEDNSGQGAPERAHRRKSRPCRGSASAPSLLQSEARWVGSRPLLGGLPRSIPGKPQIR